MNANTLTSEPIFQNSEVPVPASGTIDEHRQRRASLLHSQHYEPLIAEVLQEELPKYACSTVIDATDMIQLMRDCALILASASPVFTAAVCGNLVARILAEPELQSEYIALSARAHHQPSIYAHFLADENGVPPTPNQYLTISSMVKDYLAQGESSQHAWKIDNMTSPVVSLKASHNGHRKYLQTSSSSHSPNRIATLRRFIAGALTRWQSTPSALHDHPFPYPPSECGYSRHSPTRLAQHRLRHGSNPLMNLVEDTCSHLHRSGAFAQHFTMHPFVLVLLFRPSQAAVAEILCSALLQVWVEGGGGFNAYPAGRSVATAKRVSGHEWAEYEMWVRRESRVVENMRAQRLRADEWRRALDWEDGQEEQEAGNEDELSGG